jgi:signal transduction histidine kinase
MPARSGNGAAAVAASSRRPRAGRFASIERQLPLLILSVLVPTVVVLVVWAHAVVRGDLEDSALARTRASAGQLQAMLGKAVGGRARGAQFLGRQDPFVELARAEPEARPRAIAAVRAHLERNGRAPAVPQAVEVWSLDGELLLRVLQPRAGDELPPAHDAGPRPRTLGLQPLRVHRGQLLLDVVGAIRTQGERADEAGETLGYVVVRRHLADGDSAQMLASLILPNGSFAVGNRDGTLWTDLTAAVAAPAAPAAPAVDPSGPGAFFHGADGALRVGACVAVEDAPWLLWVEGDAGPLLAPARNLALHLGLLGAALLALGAGGALWISRRLTRPLREATRAAESIAAGRYDDRLVVRGPDEIGRLTQAFNAMAEQVERAHAELEERVAARTADLQRALAQLQEAQDDLVRQEKLALLGQLAGSVGHELRNPLAVMSHSVAWLDAVLADVPPEVRERLGVLRRQISLSEKITTDLLDFTRRRQRQTGAVALDQVVEQQLARLGSVTFRIERDFTAGEPARADAVHVGQIVFNLLTNASQAIAAVPEGRIVLRTRQHGERVRLEVEDDGPGVPDGSRAKIFEPLFTTRPHGIGLGLAVSRRLAEDNGGELRHEVPETGRGARFVLELPAMSVVRA